MTRPVFVAGIGMTPYSFPSDRPFPQIAMTAARHALDDAGVEWAQVKEVAFGTSGLGMAAGKAALRPLGPSNAAFVQVENASATGAFALRAAADAIATGRADIAMAIGVDQYGGQKNARDADGLRMLSPVAHIPMIELALLTRMERDARGLSRENLAAIAVKAHANAALNPNAQSKGPYNLDDVLASTPVAGDLTLLQCCPRGEGAAAAILCAEDALPPAARPVRLAAIAACSEPGKGDGHPSVATARMAAQAALKTAGRKAHMLDIVELHDAFPIEEILHVEAFGLCHDGWDFFASGASAIGGACAVNPSGGLIGQGHPIGPTGLGQIHEIVTQLRGDADKRQHHHAKIGMAHMIGLGTVGIASILERV